MTEAIQSIQQAIDKVRRWRRFRDHAPFYLRSNIAHRCQVSKSKKLTKVLEFVLALGNYLNGGTSQGGSYGVKLDVLLKVRHRIRQSAIESET